jgi:hypothetical protein
MGDCWITTTKGKILPHGILDGTHKEREMKRLKDVILKKLQAEALLRQQQKE